MKKESQKNVRDFWNGEKVLQADYDSTFCLTFRMKVSAHANFTLGLKESLQITKILNRLFVKTNIFHQWHYLKLIGI